MERRIIPHLLKLHACHICFEHTMIDYKILLEGYTNALTFQYDSAMIFDKFLQKTEILKKKIVANITTYIMYTNMKKIISNPLNTIKSAAGGDE